MGPLHDWYFNGDQPLVDEDPVAIDIVPVVLGGGKPYFGTLANGRPRLEDPNVVIQGDGVLHVRYPVHRGC